MSKELSLKLGQVELSIGQQISLQVGQSPLSTNPIKVEGALEDIRGGGFYGKVYLLPKEVIKTAQPDPWHLLWRRINWKGQPFPSQSSELAAQLDYLGGSIIHQVIPKMTEGRVITPQPIGHLNLGRLGHAQVLERMRGRGIKFHPETNRNENEIFSQTRRELWEIGKTLGIEQAAQVHPGNSFGKQNLWTSDNNGQMIWLDTLPAIPHNDFIWPGFKFPFHQEVRAAMNSEQPTFNTIHTQKLREHLLGNRALITESEQDKLEFYLTHYEQTLERFTQQMSENSTRQLVIQDALNRGLINQSKAKTLERSSIAYQLFLTKTIIEPAFAAFSEFMRERGIYQLATNSEARKELIETLRSPNLRRQKMLENTSLRGMREAYNQGLISEQEWLSAWEALEGPLLGQKDSKKLATTYIGLQTWYIVSSRLMNALSLSIGISALKDKNPLPKVALLVFVELVLPSIVRASSTALVSGLTKQELKAAIITSAIPNLGGWMAVPADLAHRHGKRSEQIWHYTKRAIIASLSKVMRPWGGWNSDLEADLWEKLRAEKW